MKKSQNQLVLDHLIDHGYITEVIGRSYGVRRTASRITDLKAAGVDVHSELRKDDLGTTYAYYSVTEGARAYERAERLAGNDWRSNPVKKAA